MKVLVTGGAGYIGSITATALEEHGHTPIILDSLLTGPRAFTQNRVFYEGDIVDRQLIRRIIDEHPNIECTIHMAARIIVPESVVRPYEYYRDNVAKSLELFDQLLQLQRPRVIFSSSASVYAPARGFEVFENSPLSPLSPYARTKQVMEMILADLAASTDLRAIIMRYFNPIGSDPYLRSGVHVRIPSHALGQIVMAARGQREAFMVTGVDYPTRDGTGFRDYIHVWDLALAHVRAVEQFDEVLKRSGDGQHRDQSGNRQRRDSARIDLGRRARSRPPSASVQRAASCWRRCGRFRKCRQGAHNPRVVHEAWSGGWDTVSPRLGSEAERGPRLRLIGASAPRGRRFFGAAPDGASLWLL